MLRLQTVDFLALAGLARAAFRNGITKARSKFSGNGDDGTFTFSASEGTTTVPEPASMLLMGTGLAVAAVDRRRRALKVIATT